MGSRSINLVLRFLLEMAGLAAMGLWGWGQGAGAMRFVLALGIPIAAEIIWVTFAVPDDPSRSGKAPVQVPGVARLALELVYFGFATWALYDLGLILWGGILGALVMMHYAASYDRVGWLVRQ